MRERERERENGTCVCGGGWEGAEGRDRIDIIYFIDIEDLTLNSLQLFQLVFRPLYILSILGRSSKFNAYYSFLT